MTKRTEHADDERAIAFLDSLENRLLEVLEDATRYVDENGNPQFGRWAALHAVIDLAGRQMLSAIEIDGEEGRRRCQRLLNHLEMLIAPTIGRVQ